MIYAQGENIRAAIRLARKGTHDFYLTAEEFERCFAMIYTQGENIRAAIRLASKYAAHAI